ncbi:hypothetical protein BB560_000498 [Smittium megazygosporum]|uniref:HMG box domain-containing protein n=1 Tax=Smittium megazygosporum TaxID=133381 RepID=A0A2T9ZK75_9FUNG|nr:hypothetical protein BB560_000498 [Smittium megazygosporum]
MSKIRLILSNKKVSFVTITSEYSYFLKAYSSTILKGANKYSLHVCNLSNCTISVANRSDSSFSKSANAVSENKSEPGAVESLSKSSVSTTKSKKYVGTSKDQANSAPETKSESNSKNKASVHKPLDIHRFKEQIEARIHSLFEEERKLFLERQQAHLDFLNKISQKNIFCTKDFDRELSSTNTTQSLNKSSICKNSGTSDQNTVFSRKSISKNVSVESAKTRIKEISLKSVDSVEESLSTESNNIKKNTIISNQESIKNSLSSPKTKKTRKKSASLNNNSVKHKPTIKNINSKENKSITNENIIENNLPSNKQNDNQLQKEPIVHNHFLHNHFLHKLIRTTEKRSRSSAFFTSNHNVLQQLIQSKPIASSNLHILDTKEKTKHEYPSRYRQRVLRRELKLLKEKLINSSFPIVSPPRSKATAYNLFLKSLPFVGTKPESSPDNCIPHIIQKPSYMWNLLSEEEKKPYLDQAKDRKKELAEKEKAWWNEIDPVLVGLEIKRRENANILRKALGKRTLPKLQNPFEPKASLQPYHQIFKDQLSKAKSQDK